jgi:hypothetical protein
VDQRPAVLRPPLPDMQFRVALDDPVDTYSDAAALCAKLTAKMSQQPWRAWVSPDIKYVEVCPGLPIPADG